MSERNVEVVRDAVEAFNRGDLDAALELMHPEVEWSTPDAFPDGGTYRGREAVAEFWRTWREAFTGFQLHLERCVAVGRTHVLAAFQVSGEGTGSGAGVESPTVFQLGEVRDERVVWVTMYLSEDEATGAAARRESRIP
jgi:ketosteroid isomerase-like protein